VTPSLCPVNEPPEQCGSCLTRRKDSKSCGQSAQPDLVNPPMLRDKARCLAQPKRNGTMPTPAQPFIMMRPLLPKDCGEAVKQRGQYNGQSGKGKPMNGEILDKGQSRQGSDYLVDGGLTVVLNFHEGLTSIMWKKDDLVWIKEQQPS